MVGLTIEKLVEVYRKELASQDLLELPEDFYQDVSKLTSRLMFKAKGSNSFEKELLEEELKNVIFLVQEIYSARVLKAMEKINSGETPVVLERERTAFLEVRQSLEKLHSELIGPVLRGMTTVSAPVERTRAPVVLLIDFQERILAADQKYYGPFRKGEVVNMPESNAESMLRHGYVRRMRVKV
jgi:DNA replication initiation complex subunit (GINS family)